FVQRDLSILQDRAQISGYVGGDRRGEVEPTGRTGAYFKARGTLERGDVAGHDPGAANPSGRRKIVRRNHALRHERAARNAAAAAARDSDEELLAETCIRADLIDQIALSLRQGLQRHRPAAAAQKRLK